MRILIACLALAGLSSQPARAAESYDNCSGFITSLPATLTTQGVWCMDRDLATGIASGAAITVANNNITVDCNGFKLGGLAAGTSSAAIGVHASNRLNATVRHCNVRGFNRGVYLEGVDGGGHLVEDSRFDGNLFIGIVVEGGGSIIRRNLVLDTGGLVDSTSSAGILGIGAHIFDNIVEGVTATGFTQSPFGIIANGRGASIERNTIRAVNCLNGNGQATGILAGGPSATIRGNSIVNNTIYSCSLAQRGISAASEGMSFCDDNLVAGFVVPFENCDDGTGNRSLL